MAPTAFAPGASLEQDAEAKEKSHSRYAQGASFGSTGTTTVMNTAARTASLQKDGEARTPRTVMRSHISTYALQQTFDENNQEDL